jgi:hypothetical protein
MGDLLQPLGVLTALVYGVVIAAAIRNWFRSRSAELDAGINKALGGTDPQMEARIASRERKCS